MMVLRQSRDVLTRNQIEPRSHDALNRSPSGDESTVQRHHPRLTHLSISTSLNDTLWLSGCPDTADQGKAASVKGCTHRTGMHVLTGRRTDESRQGVATAAAAAVEGKEKERKEKERKEESSMAKQHQAHPSAAPDTCPLCPGCEPRCWPPAS